MKKLFLTFLLFSGLLYFSNANDDYRADFIMGDPGIASVNALAFGPDGILFIGDSQNATITAIDTKDNTSTSAPEKLNFQKVDEHIANMLGTTADGITIQDMAVNPISKAIYLAVHTQDAQPVLLRMANDKFEVINLKKISYSNASLQKAVAADAKDRRGRSLRKWSISDLAFKNDKLMVSGLSNEEFSSAMMVFSFPFKKEEAVSTLEIYHAAHGRYETYAPIKTFMPYTLNGKEHIVASYTCTPLVIFPMDEMKAGEHTKGKTVAELGNRNTPLDIISYKKDGKEYLLLANTTRALMKIDPSKIENFDDYLTERVEESSATAGVEFIALPMVNVQQMDKFDDENLVFLQRMSNGDLNLFAMGNRRL